VDSMQEPNGATMERPDRNGLIYFIGGVVLALIIWGSQLIGVAINIWFGGFVLAIAFALVVYAFWIWERTSTWHVLLRIGTIVVAAIIYSLLVGRQMVSEWRKEHPIVAVRSQETIPQPNLRPAQPAAVQPPATIPKKRTRKSKKATGGAIIQENNGGSNNTNTQVGTAQAPIAIAPNGIANAAPNYGNQTVNTAPPDRHLSEAQKADIVSAIQGKACKITMMGALINIEDAQNYALELLKAFKAGGCDVPDGVVHLMASNGTWYGIKVTYHDDVAHPNGEMIYTPPDTPQGIVLAALDSAHLGKVMVGGNANIPKDAIQVSVGGHSK
jgi:hypothetical protein